MPAYFSAPSFSTPLPTQELLIPFFSSISLYFGGLLEPYSCGPIDVDLRTRAHTRESKTLFFAPSDFEIKI